MSFLFRQVMPNGVIFETQDSTQVKDGVPIEFVNLEEKAQELPLGDEEEIPGWLWAVNCSNSLMGIFFNRKDAIAYGFDNIGNFTKDCVIQFKNFREIEQWLGKK